MTLPILVYLAFVSAMLGLGVLRYLGRRAAIILAVILPVWLTYVGSLSGLGIVADAARRPPGIFFIVVPAILFIAIFLVRGRLGGRLAVAIPAALLIGAQVFRVGVELILHRAAADGLAPRMLTWEGANFDMLIGLSAPLVAVAFWHGLIGVRWALAWNALGLVMLLNVIARAAMTAPGPFQLLTSEVPNLVLGTFPYTFIPGFFAPLAIALHVISIRGLRRERRAMASGQTE